jgi:hypothetical protein
VYRCAPNASLDSFFTDVRLFLGVRVWWLSIGPYAGGSLLPYLGWMAGGQVGTNYSSRQSR